MVTVPEVAADLAASLLAFLVQGSFFLFLSLFPASDTTHKVYFALPVSLFHLPLIFLSFHPRFGFLTRLAVARIMLSEMEKGLGCLYKKTLD